MGWRLDWLSQHFWTIVQTTSAIAEEFLMAKDANGNWIPNALAVRHKIPQSTALVAIVDYASVPNPDPEAAASLEQYVGCDDETDHNTGADQVGLGEPSSDDPRSVDAKPALSGIGAQANIDHRLSVPLDVQESVFQAEHPPVRFQRKSEEELTVGTANLGLIADSGTTGFGH
jgi:hypothetical protein